jgi:hypothetical protein
VILEAVGKPHVTLPKPHRLSTTPAHDKVSLSTSCLHWARELATMGNNRTYAPLTAPSPAAVSTLSQGDMAAQCGGCAIQRLQIAALYHHVHLAFHCSILWLMCNPP